MRAKRALLAAAVAMGLAAAVLPARAGGVDATCVLPLTQTDAATVNVAFPDEAATYWLSAYAEVPGLRLRITGQYPHARYMSFNVYDGLQRPLDHLADISIRPDAGSTNPFVVGAARTAHRRTYNAFVDFDALPKHRAANTMYTGTGQRGLPNTTGSFIYRVYTPDYERDARGGVPLPTVTVEQASNGQPPSPSVCAAVSKPSSGSLNGDVANTSGLPAADGLQPWGSPVPSWRKFVNLPQAVADFTLANPTGGGARPLVDPVVPYFGTGAFLSNLDNQYLATAINRRYGQVLVTAFKAPTFPDTRGARRMPDGELRYWSMCSNEFFSQRFIGCRTDDQTAVDRSGYVHLVVSTPAERPRYATAACGWTWLPWGPDAEGVLIYRNMLPRRGFGASVQSARYGAEGRTMGPYLPRSHYVADAAAFDRTATCHRS